MGLGLAPKDGGRLAIAASRSAANELDTIPTVDARLDGNGSQRVAVAGFQIRTQPKRPLVVGSASRA